MAESGESVNKEKIAKILIFIQDPRVIEMATIQLEKMGHKLAFARTTIEAFAQVQSFKPDVVMLSWNLKKLNVKSLYSHFQSKLKCLVAVFSELNDPITIMKLNNSNIPNTLFPPLSAQGMHVRLQLLMQQHLEKGEHLNKTDDVGFKKVDQSQLPKDTKWVQSHFDSKPDPSDPTVVWKGVSETEKEKLYFFESPLAVEKLFTSKGSIDKSATVTLVETNHQGATVLAAIQKTKLGKEIDSIQTTEHPAESNLISLLEKIVRDSAAQCAQTVRNGVKPIDKVDGASVITVNTPRFKGYIVVAQANNHDRNQLIQQFQKILKGLLEKNGESLHESAPPFEAEFESLDFSKWVQKKSVFHISGQSGDDEVIFAFVGRKEFPAMVKVETEELLGTKIKGLLVENSRLTFDLYIHMPKNEKYLLYARKKRMVTTKFLEKLEAFNIEKIFFVPEDRGAFEQYCATSHLEFKLR